ncbi:MAG TPA: M48 family metalloprotease [Verrucomicrobiae bacterium]|nr:M48 family metalloprotease [Verrucomicrobiae bacterium]
MEQTQESITPQDPPGAEATTSPVALFQGEITPKRVSLLYQLGLGAVAFAMLLLPAMYLGLIGLVGYGVYYHMAHDLSWMQGGDYSSGPTIGGILIYFGPVVAGGILIFFMFKPFLARHREPFQPMDISRTQHPALFALIGEICRQIGAPMPKRVDVNCDVNASASFRRGILSLFGQDVVLTIGLPLVAGLDMHEFAGVLAHEFGHFAQGTAMRLTYVIRRINGWFARVVYERDQWDVWLHQMSRQRDLRLSAMFLFARFGVWLSRRTLWAFMYLGHAISCFMLRQMEYDADSYEIQLAGTDAFVSTSNRIRMLGFAAQQAYAELGERWKRRRVPDSLPTFVVNKAGTMPDEVKSRIEESSAKAATRLFHTHPSDADRIRQAQRMNAAGVFLATEPATALFHDFDELARSITIMHYQQGLRLALAPEHLVPVEETDRENRGQLEGEQAAKRFLEGNMSIFRPLTITERDIVPPADPAEAIQEMAAARQRMKQSAAEAKAAFQEFLDADKKAIQAFLATQLLTVGCKIQPKEFELPEATLEAAKRAASEAQQQREAAARRWEPFEADATRRLISDLRLLHAPEIAEGIENVEQLRAESAELVAVLAKLVSVYPSLLELRKEFLGMRSVGANRAKCPEPSRADYRVEKLAQEAQQAVQGIQTKLAHVRYPFPHAKTELCLADFAMPDRSDDHPIARSYQQASSHLDRLFGLYGRIIGRLVLIAEKVEARFDFEGTEAKPPEVE